MIELGRKEVALHQGELICDHIVVGFDLDQPIQILLFIGTSTLELVRGQHRLFLLLQVGLVFKLAVILGDKYLLLLVFSSELLI